MSEYNTRYADNEYALVPVSYHEKVDEVIKNNPLYDRYEYVLVPIGETMAKDTRTRIDECYYDGDYALVTIPVDVHADILHFDLSVTDILRNATHTAFKKKREDVFLDEYIEEYLGSTKTEQPHDTESKNDDFFYDGSDYVIVTIPVDIHEDILYFGFSVTDILQEAVQEAVQEVVQGALEEKEEHLEDYVEQCAVSVNDLDRVEADDNDQNHELYDDNEDEGDNDAINPGHYQGFSNGAQVIDIAEHLTFAGGNAVKYLARATRVDGENKGKVLEDLNKALWYVQRAIDQEKNRQEQEHLHREKKGRSEIARGWNS